MGKVYKVDLLPEDFIDAIFVSNTNCPLARAMNREFNTKFSTCSTHSASIWGDRWYGKERLKYFDIVDSFEEADHEFVKEQYDDPNCDTIYYVTLKEVEYE